MGACAHSRSKKVGRRLRRLGLGFLAVAFALPLDAGAALILINNGLAPPEPLNVVDASDSWADDDLLIRNEGCGTELDPYAFCDSPGATTRVEVASGGAITSASVQEGSAFDMSGGAVTDDLSLYGGSTSTMMGGSIDTVVAAAFSHFVLVDGTVRLASAYDSGRIGVNGGSVAALTANDTSTLRIFAGAAGSNVFGQDSATIEIKGGAFEAELGVFDLATATIYGLDFRVDGVPVPPGELAATAGVLTGELDSSEPLDLNFTRDPTARIELVPEPALGGAFAALSALVLHAWPAARRARRETRSDRSVLPRPPAAHDRH